MKKTLRISLGLFAALSSQQLMARTEISTLPFTADQAGETYVLAKDLSTASGAAITVAADNVVIDGAGHAIRYADTGAGNGVLIQDGTNGLELKNLILDQGGHDPSAGENVFAIWGRGDIGRLNIHHNTLRINHSGSQAGAYGAGINLSGNRQRSWGNLIAYNTISVRGRSGGYGISIDPGARWEGQLEGNRISLADMGREPAGYGRAIAISGDGHIQIHGNHIELADSLEQVQGISLWGASGHMIRDNEIIADSAHTRAILVDGNSDDNTVYRNRIVMRSVAPGGASAGIRVRYGSDRTWVLENDIDTREAREAFPLRIGGSDGLGIPAGTVVRGNQLRSASRALSVEEGADVRFYDNLMESSGGYAAYLAGPSHGLSFNQDRFQGSVHLVGEVSDVSFCATNVTAGDISEGSGSHDYRFSEGDCGYPAATAPKAPRNLRQG
ncbi:right-handed parallel beta-helix repeat-containing protein [Alkalilimnicola sp. S0819]|uniref:right-handed parallel beta-helix repeat-containing protein n=1 Tax=Alkalilimnicola sp. S0819 TaxID=2613922 RepID=UPI001261FE54|nr:right-handed parallel beta-helix repeat-containing protein [Alkalilimnicola sp. S0819]KAB7622866.1 right-handed parallel beta-helix repeat-containing protein [Alkalilimnicola sp. S0819]MPQ17188.1 hypothetical protein [Alkalilimnicola sp. S0819]